MTQGRDFWSRRRAGVEAEAKAEEQRATDADMAKLEERPDAELLAEANLPDPDSLDTPEAVQEFLRSELPQRLKTRALRKLWRMNPVLANLDGLVDYGEDYTDAATVIENMQTVYQVGKGMMTAFVEQDEEDTADPDGEEDAIVEARELHVAQEEAPAENPEEDTQAVTVAQMPPELIEAPEIAQPQRRMRFEFSDA
ncbi:MAG: DUF3306 domain-containing protein [Pseudomonadota bacterium]